MPGLSNSNPIKYCTYDADCGAGYYCAGGYIPSGSNPTTHACIQEKYRQFAVHQTVTVNSNQVPTGGQSTATAVELGTKFASSVSGTIYGIRFYNPSGETGTHTAQIWDNSGNALMTLGNGYSTTSRSAFKQISTSSPWQELTVATDSAYPPVVGIHIAANTNYTVGVNFNAVYPWAHYALPTGENPLYTVGGSGVYNTTAGSYPTSTYEGSNYFVDVAFLPDTAHGNSVVYGSNYNTSTSTSDYSYSIALGEDSASTNFDCQSSHCAGSNGGVNAQFLINSCGFRRAYVERESTGFFAGVHMVFASMPTQYYFETDSSGHPLYLHYTDRALSTSGTSMAIVSDQINRFPGAIASEAFTTPTAVYNSFTSAEVNSSTGAVTKLGASSAEGCNIAMSAGSSSADAHSHLDVELWSDVGNEAKDPQSNASGTIWEATCNHDPSTYGW